MRPYSLIALSALAALASTAVADSVLTSGSPLGEVIYFGEPDTATYGQTFTVGADQYLTSFSFWLRHDSGDSSDFSFYVMEWDGANSMATGPVLFSSGPYSITSTTMSQYTYNTGALLLNSGSEYVAFINTSNEFDSDGNTGAMAGASSNYAGGRFVFLNHGGNFGALTTNTWTINWLGTGDAAFEANFASAAPNMVPVPAAVWGGLGLLGLMGGKKALRRKPM